MTEKEQIAKVVFPLLPTFLFSLQSEKKQLNIFYLNFPVVLK